MEEHSEEYNRIRAKAENWPEWKRECYNNDIAISAHAKKLPCCTDCSCKELIQLCETCANNKKSGIIK